MKQLIPLSLLLFSICGCMSPDGQMYPKSDGQLVMYGDLPHSEIEAKQKEYIQRETVKFGTRKDASLSAPSVKTSGLPERTTGIECMWHSK
jgi:uncharacterized protein YcfL